MFTIVITIKPGQQNLSLGIGDAERSTKTKRENRLKAQTRELKSDSDRKNFIEFVSNNPDLRHSPLTPIPIPFLRMCPNRVTKILRPSVDIALLSKIFGEHAWLRLIFRTWVILYDKSYDSNLERNYVKSDSNLEPHP
ncbi:hypothetical protein FQA39_LY06609 [Lamprigera yunnana]|nr:hypothetical protein FQA39_LY06609 [Lamprigera yunnana]